MNILVIILFFVLFVMLFCLSVKKSFRKFNEDILYKHMFFLDLKTDWETTLLEYFAEKTEYIFNTSFLSLFSLKNIDTVTQIISFSTKKANFLKDFVIKEDFLFRKKKSLMPLVYKVDNIFDPEKEGAIKKEYIKYSFMIPLAFSKQIDDAYLCLFFTNWFSYVIAYLKFVVLSNSFSLKYAMLLRNFYATFENSASSLLSEIEDYVAISLDKNAKIIAWNKGAEKLFSYRGFEIIGQNFDVLFNIDEQETFSKSLEVLLIKKDIKFFSTLQDRMGIPIRVEITIKSKFNSLGALIGYSVFVKDITKEEIFKENVQQHSFINYTILENSQDGILILDSSDKIIFYNQRVRLILDNSMNLFGIPGKKIFPRRFGEEFEKAIELLKKTGQEFIDIDYCFERKYYNIRFFQVYKNTNSYKKNTHEYGGVIVFFIDESMRMMTLLELEEKKEALEKINCHLLDAISSARLMQHNLIPLNLPNDKNFHCQAIYELSDDLGGDFYFAEKITVHDKEYGVVIVSDVSGHGISASMLNVMVKEIYGTFKDFLSSQNILDPDVFLQTLNKKIIELRIEDKFITCLIAIIDFENKNIKMSSAGHPLPYVISNNKVQILSFQKSIPTGIMDVMSCFTHEVSYQDGDKFIFYTDGFLDLFEAQGSTPSKEIEKYLNDQNTLTFSIKELKNDILIKHKNYKMIHRSSVDDLTLVIVQL